MSVHYFCDNCDNDYEKDELFEVTISCSDPRLEPKPRGKRHPPVERVASKEWCKRCIASVMEGE